LERISLPEKNVLVADPIRAKGEGERIVVDAKENGSEFDPRAVAEDPVTNLFSLIHRPEKNRQRMK
jgi:hypothetical protein